MSGVPETEIRTENETAAETTPEVVASADATETGEITTEIKEETGTSLKTETVEPVATETKAETSETAKIEGEGEAATTENVAVEEEVGDIESGLLQKKGSFGILTDRWFYFTDDAFDLSKLKVVHKKQGSKSKEDNHAILQGIAHATQTGKGLLFYCLNQKTVAEPHGIIVLSQVTSVEPAGGGKHHFKVVTSHHTWDLAAHSEKDLKRWIQTIKKKMEEAKTLKVEETEEYKTVFEKLVNKTAFAVSSPPLSPVKGTETAEVIGETTVSEPLPTDEATESKVEETSASGSKASKRRSLFIPALPFISRKSPDAPIPGNEPKLDTTVETSVATTVETTAVETTTSTEPAVVTTETTETTTVIKVEDSTQAEEAKQERSKLFGGFFSSLPKKYNLFPSPTAAEAPAVAETSAVAETPAVAETSTTEAAVTTTEVTAGTTETTETTEVTQTTTTTEVSGVIVTENATDNKLEGAESRPLRKPVLTQITRLFNKKTTTEEKKVEEAKEEEGSSAAAAAVEEAVEEPSTEEPKPAVEESTAEAPAVAAVEKEKEKEKEKKEKKEEKAHRSTSPAALGRRLTSMFKGKKSTETPPPVAESSAEVKAEVGKTEETTEASADEAKGGETNDVAATETNEVTEEIKADEVKADEVKADEVKTDEVKTDEVKADEVKAEEIQA